MNEPTPVLLMAHQLDLGGTERQLTEVAKGLNRDEFTPHVACFHPNGIRADELRAAGVPILHLPVTSFASVSALRGGWRLMRYIGRHAIRLVHSFDVPLNVFGVPFGRLANGPTVLSSQRAHRNLTPGVYTQLLRVTDQMVDGTVVNCVHMRDHLTRDERVAPEKIHLCFNGIDLGEFRREGPVSRGTGDKITIGSVCALRPEKGLPTLIEAFAAIRARHAAVRLVLVGSGPMLGELRARAERLGVVSDCTFVPKTNDVAPWMRGIDIFVLPSLSEALSNSLMEAMACGCCCVASRVGGNPELMGERERGLLVPAGDSGALHASLEELIAGERLRRELAAAGHEFIHSRFSQRQSVRRMEEIYRGFLAQ